MISTRRLVMSVLCTTTLTAALVAASPAVALAPASHRADACGASASDVAGTFAGIFDNNPAATLSVTFTAPKSVATQWSVPGWNGSGKGEYELSATGPEWTNSNTVDGTLTGVDQEIFRSVSVTCANGDSQVTTIAGLVDSGKAEIPFTINRQ
ncbi:hypothetical protein P3T36_002311 [Kitasatospora sp. MAP12-15]|uniref:hypothetical protein n=1 Tax=unclassified Kitasatospora TaxID=2633591 RepID=UPI002474BEFD|nr:hypothetical protein [Kitasatospora sp. MAP12-44]MDH6108768.1 hypothetical protein [Kitasatospora sp. MAP12-44]